MLVDMRDAIENMRRAVAMRLIGMRRRKGDAHWKALGRALLNVEASKIPVELRSRNRHGSSRGIEGTSARTSAPTTSSSSCWRHAKFLKLYESRYIWQSFFTAGRLGVVESKFAESCGVRNYFDAVATGLLG